MAIWGEPLASSLAQHISTGGLANPFNRGHSASLTTAQRAEDQI